MRIGSPRLRRLFPPYSNSATRWSSRPELASMLLSLTARMKRPEQGLSNRGRRGRLTSYWPSTNPPTTRSPSCAQEPSSSPFSIPARTSPLPRSWPQLASPVSAWIWSRAFRAPSRWTHCLRWPISPVTAPSSRRHSPTDAPSVARSLRQARFRRPKSSSSVLASPVWLHWAPPIRWVPRFTPPMSAPRPLSRCSRWAPPSYTCEPEILTKASVLTATPKRRATTTTPAPPSCTWNRLARTMSSSPRLLSLASRPPNSSLPRWSTR